MNLPVLHAGRWEREILLGSHTGIDSPGTAAAEVHREKSGEGGNRGTVREDPFRSLNWAGFLVHDRKKKKL